MPQTALSNRSTRNDFSFRTSISCFSSRPPHPRYDIDDKLFLVFFTLGATPFCALRAEFLFRLRSAQNKKNKLCEFSVVSLPIRNFVFSCERRNENRRGALEALSENSKGFPQRITDFAGKVAPVNLRRRGKAALERRTFYFLQIAFPLISRLSLVLIAGKLLAGEIAD